MNQDSVTVFFDSPKNRLVYRGRPADEAYWDKHWSKDADAVEVRRYNRFVARETAKWLPKGSRVIDAGCGLAHTVYSLDRDGFDAYGIDYAPETVRFINEAAPNLKVTVGDVRDMSQFPDNFFDGYWSLGVIEHFFEGYDDILQEMHRVIRPGGYAFVTVPSMSPLRKWKARRSGYAPFDGINENFYQFVLPPEDIIRNFQQHGFRYVSGKGRGGLKGLKDEVPAFRKPLQRLFDSRSKLAKAAKAAIDLAASPWAFHTRFYLFKK